MHMIVMVVGEIDIECVEMMIIQIVDQRIVLVPQIGIHQQVLSSAREHCAVAPYRVVSVIDRCDLHVSARRFCLKRWSESCEDQNDSQQE